MPADRESDRLDLISALMDALQAVSKELAALNDLEEYPWPDEIVKGMEERIALVETLKYALASMPERRAEFEEFYLDAYAKAHWREPGGNIPVEEDVLEHVERVEELLRLRRVFDRPLDEAVRRFD